MRFARPRPEKILSVDVQRRTAETLSRGSHLGSLSMNAVAHLWVALMVSSQACASLSIRAARSIHQHPDEVLLQQRIEALERESSHGLTPIGLAETEIAREAEIEKKERDAEILHGLYLGDVAEADRKVARIFEAVREAVGDAEVLSFVASDHGEVFGERFHCSGGMRHIFAAELGGEQRGGDLGHRSGDQFGLGGLHRYIDF